MVRRIWISFCLLALLGGGCGDGESRSELGWYDSPRSALAEADRTHRPVMIAFFAAWSDWCRRLESEVLTAPQVKRELETYLLVRVDVEEEPELPRRYGVLSFPTLLILDHQGEEYYRITGFRTAEQMARELAAARKAAGR